MIAAHMVAISISFAQLLRECNIRGEGPGGLGQDAKVFIDIFDWAKTMETLQVGTSRCRQGGQSGHTPYQHVQGKLGFMYPDTPWRCV